MAVESILSSCDSTEMIFAECARTPELSDLEERIGDSSDLMVTVAEVSRMKLEINDILIREHLVYFQSQRVPNCTLLERLLETNAARVPDADDILDGTRSASN